MVAGTSFIGDAHTVGADNPAIIVDISHTHATQLVRGTIAVPHEIAGAVHVLVAYSLIVVVHGDHVGLALGSTVAAGELGDAIRNGPLEGLLGSTPNAGEEIEAYTVNSTVVIYSQRSAPLHRASGWVDIIRRDEIEKSAFVIPSLVVIPGSAEISSSSSGIVEINSHGI